MNLCLSIRALALLIVITAFGYTAKAQNLPNTQSMAVMAPANVLIDGKAKEWGTSYQAYNKAIEVFYTIANDKDNLYLVIHADKVRIIEKIIEAGIEFKVTETANKGAKNIFSVLFPLLPLNVAKTTLVAAGKPVSGLTFADKSEMTSGSNYTTEALRQEAKENSQLTVFDKPNKLLHSNLKVIKVLGASSIVDTVPGITDTTKYYNTLPLRRHHFKIIPLINQDDIMAMVQFDNKGELTYELNIPLKYLNTSKGNSKLYYHITIHGRGEGGRIGNTITVSRLPNGRAVGDNQDLESPTDFSGEYTLYGN
ncbi:MAG: hypothetical protein EOP47_05470 [Sphingobacteriaceae bacterium]|nr:MAG: hypothetical protein EOP47_05470 [Sphingobacteriaceae bacterium]